jgi:hypothetical protein
MEPEPEERAPCTTRQGRRRRENAPLKRRRRRFLGFLPILGVLPAALQDLAAYGKETCKMSENKVVHHKRHYR